MPTAVLRKSRSKTRRAVLEPTGDRGEFRASQLSDFLEKLRVSASAVIPKDRECYE